MQTKCQAKLPQTLSAHFILKYMVNCSSGLKPFWGISQKKKQKKKKKSCNFTWVFHVVQGNSAQILSLYVTSKELIIE